MDVLEFIDAHSYDDRSRWLVTRMVVQQVMAKCYPECRTPLPYWGWDPNRWMV